MPETEVLQDLPLIVFLGLVISREEASKINQEDNNTKKLENNTPPISLVNKVNLGFHPFFERGRIGMNHVPNLFIKKKTDGMKITIR